MSKRQIEIVIEELSHIHANDEVNLKRVFELTRKLADIVDSHDRFLEELWKMVKRSPR